MMDKKINIVLMDMDIHMDQSISINDKLWK